MKKFNCKIISIGIFAVATVATGLLTSCGLEADVRFPSDTEIINSSESSSLKAQEVSKFCDAKNVKLTMAYPSGFKYILDYGTISAGKRKTPEITAVGTISSSDAFSQYNRIEDFESSNCGESLGS